MWKRMSEEEARRERNKARWDIKDPGFWAIFIFLISAVTIKTGFSKMKADFFPISWEEFLQEGLCIAILFGLATFLVLYIPQIVFKRNFASGPPVVMCLQCGKLKNGKKASPCDCGGGFIPLDQLEWVVDEEVQEQKGDERHGDGERGNGG